MIQIAVHFIGMFNVICKVVFLFDMLQIGCYSKSHLNAKTFQMFFSCPMTVTFLSENCAKSFDTGFNKLHGSEHY